MLGLCSDLAYSGTENWTNCVVIKLNRNISTAASLYPSVQCTHGPETFQHPLSFRRALNVQIKIVGSRPGCAMKIFKCPEEADIDRYREADRERVRYRENQGETDRETDRGT